MPPYLIGVFLTLLALSLALLSGVIVKQISLDVPLITILLGRFWFSLPILLAVAYGVRGRNWLTVKDKKTLLFRVIFGFCGITFWFLSIRHVPIGLATSLFQSSVIFITLMSPFLLGERVGIYRWTAVIAGLAGVLLITDPFHDGFPPGVIFGVLAALSGASLSITLRKLGKSEHPLSVASLYNLAGGVVVAMVAIALPSQFILPNMADSILIVMLGVVGSFLQICFTSAFRFADATIIAIMRYLQVPGAIVVGYIMFSEVPTYIQILGTTIVVGASVFIILRELYLNRQKLGGM